MSITIVISVDFGELSTFLPSRFGEMSVEALGGGHFGHDGLARTSSGNLNLRLRSKS
jgi:hypothetical protein